MFFSDSGLYYFYVFMSIRFATLRHLHSSYDELVFYPKYFIPVFSAEVTETAGPCAYMDICSNKV